MMRESTVLRHFEKATKAMLEAKRWGPSHMWWTMLSQHVIDMGLLPYANPIFDRLVAKASEPVQPLT